MKGLRKILLSALVLSLVLAMAGCSTCKEVESDGILWIHGIPIPLFIEDQQAY